MIETWKSYFIYDTHVLVAHSGIIGLRKINFMVWSWTHTG